MSHFLLSCLPAGRCSFTQDRLVMACTATPAFAVLQQDRRASALYKNLYTLTCDLLARKHVPPSLASLARGAARHHDARKLGHGNRSYNSQNLYFDGKNRATVFASLCRGTASRFLGQKAGMLTPFIARPLGGIIRTNEPDDKTLD